MILTDFYQGEKLPNSAKTRYDITASTGSYEPFEILLKNKKGELSFYFGDAPSCFRFSGRDRPDKAITRGVNISSVFVPDPSSPFAYGDIRGTSDALIMMIHEDYRIIELFIARGQKNNRRNIYTLVVDGELDNEIIQLRKKIGAE